MQDESIIDGPEAIAVIGLAGQFPKAKNVDEFWERLRDGVELVSFYTDEELLAAGISADLLKNPLYVKAGAMMDDVPMFDAAFFGYSPREAEILDPQQRHFLECSWEALENAGYDSERFDGLIGVFAGVSINNYFLQKPHRATRPDPDDGNFSDRDLERQRLHGYTRRLQVELERSEHERANGVLDFARCHSCRVSAPAERRMRYGARRRSVDQPALQKRLPLSRGWHSIFGMDIVARSTRRPRASSAATR
jgi:hypothetical protein